VAAQGAAAAGGGFVICRCARVVIALMLFACGLFAQGSGAHGAAAEEPAAIVRAESAIDRQQWAEAEGILRKLVAADAKDARAWFDLGFVIHAQQNYPEAIHAYRGAIAAEPSSFECNLNLGLMLAHENNSEASKYLEMATRLKPTSADPQKALSHAWAALAQVQEASAPVSALASWSKAVELAPNDAQDRLDLGAALEKAGDVAGAEREFRKATELQPHSTEALAALSNLFMRAKRLGEAEETLSRLVSESPQDESGHLQLGRVLSAEIKDAEAVAELQKALALRADDPEALRELAFVQQRNKQFPEAETNYRRLLKQFPNDAEVHNGLASVLLRQLKYADAQSEFIVCLRLKPDWGEAYGQLALAASGNKDYPLAIKALDARKKFLPELPSSYFLRATCYDHLRQFTEAVQNYKAFLAASNGQFPDDEWKARHRLIAIEPEAKGKK
jgi:tetratricopeptide (TPR) repeat protein